MLHDLARLRDGVSRRVSSYDTRGGNADSHFIRDGETFVLADLKGAGIIRHIWFTILAGGDFPRQIVLRMYWDDMDYPSVEAPIGDFFGIGHAQLASLNTVPFSVSATDYLGPKAAFNCYWPMPFATRARITVHNETGADIPAFYSYIDYDQLPSIPDDLGRFHAWWNRNNPCKPPRHPGKDPQFNLTDRDNYLIADIRGRGHFVGCNLSVHNLYGGWWGEGDDMFMVDGQKWPPDLHGTGSEDYFGHAWGMQPENAFIYNGVSYYKKGTEPGAFNERITVYRYHINDPIIFQKSLRASIEHGHANDRCDDYCSTAYWYQTLPHKKFPPFPKMADRLPRPDVQLTMQPLDAPIMPTDLRHRSGQAFPPMRVIPPRPPRKKTR